MKSRFRTPVVVAATALMFATAQAGELQVRAIPKPVRDAVTARFKGPKIVGAATEKNEAGDKVYEVTLKDKGKNIDVTLTPAGTIVLIEFEIDFKELPAAVVDTLAHHYPKAKYRTLERVMKVEDGVETLAYYEALFLDAGKLAMAVELDAGGKILLIEKKTSLEE